MGRVLLMESPRSVETLGPGHHACLTFSDPDERLDIVAAFVSAGLRQGHKVLCFTDSVPPERLPRELELRSVATLEAIRSGQLAVTLHNENRIVRICRQHSRPGVRVAGEIDFTGAEPLTQALAESLRLDQDVHVNLAHLRYIDVSCVSIILQAARSLPADRRL